MEDLLEPLEATAAKCLAPGLTLFRRFLNDAAQLALAGEVAELVLRAPWFVPRMPRSGKAFSVRMTNCGCLGWVSDRDGGYRYQAAHPFTGNAWPAIPSSVLNIWRARLPGQFIRFLRVWGCTRTATRRSSPRRLFRSRLAIVAASVLAVCTEAIQQRSLNCAPAILYVMGGAARLMFHGVDEIFAGSSGILPGGERINLTLRRVTRP